MIPLEDNARVELRAHCLGKALEYFGSGEMTAQGVVETAQVFEEWILRAP